MLHAYWPWWLGGAALATIGLLHFKLLGRTLGVSSCWRRVADWRLERAREREEAPFAADPSQLDAALIAATEAEFGSQVDEPAMTPPPALAPPTARALRPWTVDLVFLLAVGVGGFLVAWLAGSAPLSLHWTLGPEFERLFGSGVGGWVALVGGGILVGFGTRMAGGCTSGHGLTGTARFELPSIAATAAFFGSGVLLSFVLEALS
jgi:uncharacterized membrane protein YedE/YeeE